METPDSKRNVEREAKTIERVTVSNLTTLDLLKERFVDDLKKIEEETDSEIVPIAIGLMSIPKDPKKFSLNGIMLSHDSQSEFTKKQISVTMIQEDKNMLNKILEALKKI